MLAYAPRPDQKKLRPATLGLIVLGHAGLLALVMTAKSGAVFKDPFEPTTVILIKQSPPPAPPPPEPQPNPQPIQSRIDTVPPLVPPIPSQGPIVDDFPQPLPQPGPLIGTGMVPTPVPLDPPITRSGPRFATADDLIRPPYPDSKRISGDEASLRLKLTIDDRGRVTAVDAIGRADPTFLAAARRHILRAWRYRPAMEGTKAVPSTTVITLTFELGNA